MAAKHAHLDEIVVHPLISHRMDAASIGMDLVGYNYMTAWYERMQYSTPTVLW